MKYLAYFFVVFASPVQADAPPTWEEFIITSESGEFSATVTSQNSKWLINVYRGRRGSFPPPTEQPLWSASYNYDGYPSGALSDDGQVFVYLNTWFHPRRTVLTIIRDNCVLIYPGNHFIREQAHLRDSSSHKLWLENQQPIFSKAGDVSEVTIQTYAGIKRVTSKCK